MYDQLNMRSLHIHAGMNIESIYNDVEKKATVEELINVKHSLAFSNTQ